MHIEYRTIVVGIVVSVLSISIFVVNVAAKRQQLHWVYVLSSRVNNTSADNISVVR